MKQPSYNDSNRSGRHTAASAPAGACLRTAAALAAMLLVPALVSAQEQISVGTTGNQTHTLRRKMGRPQVFRVPADYPTIQRAIRAAAEGDIVRVSAGTYHETIDFLGKAILVHSVDGPGQTTIDGGLSGSVVTFASGESGSSALEGFTITNGLAERGAGVYCSGSSPLIQGNVITGNTTPSSSGWGGGIYCTAASPTISSNVISGNSARFYGCGISCDSGSSPTITGNLISGNTAISAADGGGLDCHADSNPEVTGNTFSNNSATDGGGISLYDSAPVISGNTFELNVASNNGAGIFCYTDSSPSVTGNVFRDNVSGGAGGGLYAGGLSGTVDPLVDGNTFERNEARFGGGMFLSDGTSAAIASNNVISENSADLRGGGICCEFTDGVVRGNDIFLNTTEGKGGGLYVRNDDPTIEGNVITDNAAVTTGGGVEVLACDGLFRANVVSFNIASDDGGGFHLVNADPVLVNNVIHDNVSAVDGGGVCCDNSSPTLTNNTIARNDADAFGGGLACFNGSSPSVSNTILWGDEAFAGFEIWDDLSGILVVDRCDVEGGWFGANLMFPPQFVDAASGDFHLVSGSPLIDKGDNLASDLPEQDYEGDPRVLDGDHIPGAIVDMGADEFSD